MRMREENEKTDLKLNIQKNQDHGIWSHHFMANRWGKVETVTDFIFLGSKITSDDAAVMKLKMLAPWKESYDKPRQLIK